MKVAVLFGGRSTEHLVSCRSAFNIIQGLRAAGHTVYPIGLSPEGPWWPWLNEALEGILSADWVAQAQADWLASGRQMEGAAPFDPTRLFEQLLGGVRPDVVFPAVHGINCEDGTLQGLLECTRVPYVGCRVMASALGMNKVYTKRTWAAAGLPVVPSVEVNRQDLAHPQRRETVITQLEHQLGYPMFLKPAAGGSSVGTLPARDRAALEGALDAVSVFGDQVLVERYVRARELEVAVLGNRALQTATVGEIIVRDAAGYYDYETKYFSETASEAKLPADLSPQQVETLHELARQAYQALDARGLARVDFFMEQESGTLYLNEINTLPGFTAISLYPQAFAYDGLDLPALTTKLCELALEEWQASRRQELV